MKILQFTTYSLKELDHGGKIRAYYIKQGLSSFGKVETVSFSWGDNDVLNGFEVELSSTRYAEKGGHYLLGDIAIDNYIKSVDWLYCDLGNIIRDYHPTHILIEQPFLWPLIKRLINDGYINTKVKIIYSSHNIEHRLKEKIYDDLLSIKNAKIMTERVKKIEIDLAVKSHLMFSVSSDEMFFLSKINGKSPIIIVPNGNDIASDQSRLSYWEERFAVEDGINWIFIGSWHPPNINGLLELNNQIVNTSNFNGIKIWIFGSVGNGIQVDNRWVSSQNSPFQIIGPVSLADLEGAIQACNGIILPIWEGAGSNLKTSQALISRKKVVASHFAFRGFEDFVTENGVLVVDTPSDFVEKLRTENKFDEYLRPNCEAKLTWSGILKEFVNNPEVVKFCEEHV